MRKGKGRWNKDVQEGNKEEEEHVTSMEKMNRREKPQGET